MPEPEESDSTDRRRLIGALELCSVFHGLSASEVESVLDAGEVRQASPGEEILRRGDADDTMLIVLSGEVELAADERTLATVLAGGEVGEVALFRQGERRVDVAATRPTSVFLLRRAGFARLVEEEDPAAFKVGLNIARVLAEHVCRVQGSLDNPCRCGVEAARTSDIAHLRDVLLTQWLS